MKSPQGETRRKSATYAPETCRKIVKYQPKKQVFRQIEGFKKENPNRKEYTGVESLSSIIRRSVL